MCCYHNKSKKLTVNSPINQKNYLKQKIVHHTLEKNDPHNSGALYHLVAT